MVVFRVDCGQVRPNLFLSAIEITSQDEIGN